MKRENLIIISFDQWRGDWCPPNKLPFRLPTLERLSKRGIVANKCYTNSPHCVPARMSWITGLRPSRFGITQNGNYSLRPNAPSIIRNLQKQGWYTTVVGKTHWTSHQGEKDLRVDEQIIMDLGFNQVVEIAGPKALRRISCQLTDEWDKRGYRDKYKEDMQVRYGKGLKGKPWIVKETILPYELYPDHWIANKGIAKIEEQPEDKEWLIWISFVGPHEPFDTPKHWKSLKARDFIDKNKLNSNNNAEKLPECELKESLRRWRGLINFKEIQELRKDYAEKLIMLDYELGRIVNAAEKRSDRDKINILIMADHGELLGDMKMLYKGSFIESAVRVPFLYCSINKKSQQLIEGPVELTKAFKRIISDLNEEQGNKQILFANWAKNQDKAVSEYRKERMFVYQNKKLVMNEEGTVLWGEELVRGVSTPCILSDKEILKNKDTKRWRSIYDWASRKNRRLNNSAGRFSSILK